MLIQLTDGILQATKMIAKNPMFEVSLGHRSVRVNNKGTCGRHISKVSVGTGCGLVCKSSLNNKGTYGLLIHKGQRQQAPFQVGQSLESHNVISHPLKLPWDLPCIGEEDWYRGNKYLETTKGTMIKAVQNPTIYCGWRFQSCRPNQYQSLT